MAEGGDLGPPLVGGPGRAVAVEVDPGVPRAVVAELDVAVADGVGAGVADAGEQVRDVDLVAALGEVGDGRGLPGHGVELEVVGPGAAGHGVRTAGPADQGVVARAAGHVGAAVVACLHRAAAG